MNALEADIREMIALQGPLSLAAYINLALQHPLHGYYRRQMPIGAAGDFITAPEVSQMFGELLGLWAADVYERMGGPERVMLVELGPGRGTLLRDALRAARVAQGFFSALEVHLVEVNPQLRASQAEALQASGLTPHWHDAMASLPDAPMIVIANEFFDCFPVQQFLRRDGAWHEVCVTIGDEGDLQLAAAPQPVPGLPEGAPDESLLEIGASAHRTMYELGARITRHGGAALVIDYGYLASRLGSSLQALRAHRRVDPLSDPGENDITAHVDFSSLARAAKAAGLNVAGLVTQRNFLRSIGIETRASALMRRADDAGRASIEAALARLLGDDPGMGQLFKVLGVASPGIADLPGFQQGNDDAF